MEKYLTQLDLIRFIYKETSTSETMYISEALGKDPLLAEEHEELFEGYRHFPRAKFSPRASTLQTILRHSEQTALNTMH
ncbi:MAG TPA: hypothetical protein ENJ95_21695 [Bacteroidetes bacterium]|nr:hypothetical protein [Bacteroidota bacterium]